MTSCHRGIRASLHSKAEMPVLQEQKPAQAILSAPGQDFLSNPSPYYLFPFLACEYRFFTGRV